MEVVGVALVLVGAALLVAEAHVPAGILGVLGGISLVSGAVLAIGAAGGGLALTLPVALGVSFVVGLWLAIVTRKTLATQRLRASSGREALTGRMGEVRSWAGAGGQVLVDGALWRARPSWPDADEHLGVGDQVVVERVSGLTLGVRKAEEWEEP